MACDTFIKIAQKCRRQFVQIQVGEVMPFIDELLANINSIICDLQPQQVKQPRYSLMPFKTKPELRLQLSGKVLVKNLLRNFISSNLISNNTTSLYHYLKCEQAFTICLVNECLYGGCWYQVTCQIKTINRNVEPKEIFALPRDGSEKTCS